MAVDNERMLTGDEIEVLALIGSGLSAFAIAIKLARPIDSIAVCLTRIRHKLDVDSTAEALDEARQRGLLR